MWRRAEHFLLLGIAILILAGCASTRSLSTGSIITIPDPPSRLAWKQDGTPEKPGTVYLDKYEKLRPDTDFHVPNDGQGGGGVFVTNSAWRGIHYAMSEWPKWGETVEKIVTTHNRGVERREGVGERWWEFWR
jgi:hypothetical protein